MQKFSFKRLTAWMLTLVMLVSIVPVNAAAISWEDFLNSFMSQSQSSTAPVATANSGTMAGNTAGTYGLTRATGETIYVLAGGDFQEAGDHANSAANVTNILAQVG